MHPLRIALCRAFALAALIAWPAPAHAATPFPVGLNYPWFQENGQHLYGQLFGDLTDARKAAIEAHFTDMQDVGITTLRLWLFADGWRWPERKDGHFQPLPDPFVNDMLWFLGRAHAHGIAVQPSLWDFYVNKSHRDYLTQPAYLPELISKVITPLAHALKDAPGLGVVDIFNEPEWTIHFDASQKVEPRRGFDPGPPNEFPVLQRFVKAHVDALHAEGLRCTVGSAGTQWVARWKGLGLDEYQVHYYPKPMAGWLGNAQFRLLTAVSKLGLDRSCVLGEFPPNQPHTDLPTVLGIIRDKGYAGALAWEYFGDGFPENLAHPFSFRARRAEFKAFISGSR